MDVDRFERLSSRQRDCLRLLLVEGSSKAVAEELRISPGTVDQHLKAARRVLGVSDSWTASRLVADYERALPQKLDTQTEAVVGPSDVGPSATATNDRLWGRDESEPAGVAENGGRESSRTLWALLFPSVGRPKNELGIQARLVLIGIQAAVLVAAVLSLFALVFLMSRFLAELARQGG